MFEDAGAGDADPDQCALPSFIVGQDAWGRWLVRDEDGLIGGLFRDRLSAERFAAFESGHRPGAVRLAPLGWRLELTGPLPRGLRSRGGQAGAWQAPLAKTG